MKPQADLYPSSPAMEYLTAQPEPIRVLDWDTGGENAQASFLGIGAPQAMVYRVATPRGYNPLDVRHYREFLAFVVDDRPVRGNSPYTQQVIPNFEVGNPELFRLLAVTHRVVPDDAPPLPGMWKPRLVDPAPPAPPPLLPESPNPLPPHALTEAANPRPRAWVVPRAERLVTDHLATLKSCDFANTVLITSSDVPPYPNGQKPGTARIAEYRPNRVAVDLDGTGGWLVLSDVWFPGWTCRVDGVEVPVYRANHAFRAVPVPAGAKQAEFTFSPRSYRVGWWVSVCCVAASRGRIGCAAGVFLHCSRRENKAIVSPRTPKRTPKNATVALLEIHLEILAFLHQERPRAPLSHTHTPPSINYTIVRMDLRRSSQLRPCRREVVAHTFTWSPNRLRRAFAPVVVMRLSRRLRTRTFPR